MALLINTNNFPVPIGEGLTAFTIPAHGRRNVKAVPTKLPKGVVQAPEPKVIRNKLKTQGGK